MYEVSEEIDVLLVSFTSCPSPSYAAERGRVGDVCATLETRDEATCCVV